MPGDAQAPVLAVPELPPSENRVPVGEPTRMAVDAYEGAFQDNATTFVPAGIGLGVAESDGVAVDAACLKGERF